jgi:hypothetical protein
MEKEIVKKYVGKKCLIILDNNFNYTGIIPNFNGNSFSIRDIFGKEVSIDCEFIAFIKEVENGHSN